MRIYRRKAQIFPSGGGGGGQTDRSNISKISATVLNDRNRKRRELGRLILLFCSSWISCLITPIVIGIFQRTTLSNWLIIIGLICDFITLIDLIVESNLNSKKTQIYLRFNPFAMYKTDKWNYVLKFCDILSLFPLLILPGELAMVPINLTWCLIPRMLRVVTLMNTYQLIKTKKEFAFFSNETVSRVLLIFLLGSLHASLLSCVWFKISCPNRENCPQSNAWVAYDTILETDRVFSPYIRSLYFIIQTLFTIGYGDISPQNDLEIFFTLFLIFNGSLFYGFLISSLTSLLSNKDVSNQRFRSDLSLIRTYCDLRNIPGEIRGRIDQLFQFILSRQGGMLENQFLLDLPIFLSREVMQNFQPMLKNLSFFRSQDEKLTNLCAERLLFRTYVPNSVIFFQNERKRELILIRTGRIDIKVQTSKSALFSAMTGDNLGEFEFFFGTPCPVTAETSAFTEVMVLHFHSFTEAVQLSSDGIDIETWLTMQQEALDEVVESHKKFLSRVIKVRLTIEDLQKKRKMIDMMASISEDSKIDLIESRPIWLVIVIFGSFYFMIVSPFRFLIPISLLTEFRILWSIECPRESIFLCLSSWDWTLLVDYLLDIVFFVDVILNSFFFAFLRFEAQREIIVSDKFEIFEKFFSSSRAPISFFAILPFDLIAISYGWILCFRSVCHLFSGSIYLRLTKLIWSLLLFENISSLLNFYEKYYDKSLLSAEGLNVLFLSIITAAVAMYMSILWSVIHETGTIASFVEGLYFCLTTMTTVGYGDIVPTSNELTLYVVCLSIIGPCTCATIIANAASYMRNSDASVDNLSHRMTVVKTFLNVGLLDSFQPESSKKSRRRSRLERETAIDSEAKGDHPEILSYVEYMEKEKNGIDESKFLETLLPDYLQDDIRQYLTMDFILSSKFFSSCDTSFLRSVMLSMELQFFPPGKIVVYPGLPSSGMYILQDGFVQISTAQGRKTQKLSRGNSFGEIFLFDVNGYCNFRADSSSSCEVWYLSRLMFLELTQSHGITPENPMFEKMSDFAKESCRSLIDTPLPSVQALQALHEFRAAENEFWIVKPASLKYQIWLITLVVVIFYNVFLIPFGAAYLNTNFLNTPIVWLLYVGDCLFLADMLLRMFFLGFVDQNELITLRSNITKNYLNHQFRYHFLSILPLELFIFVGIPKYETIFQTLMIFRVNKLIRVIDLPHYFSALELCLFSRSSVQFKHLTTLMRLIFIVFLAAHFAGCLFFIVASQKHFHGSLNNWADYAGILRSCSFDSNDAPCGIPTSIRLVISQYVHSVYWATGTLTTVGYGDIFPISMKERLFCLIVFFTGTSVYSMVITCLQDIVSNLDVTSDIYKSRYDRIRKLLLRENCSDEIKRKATLYLERMWVTQRGAQGSSLDAMRLIHIGEELKQFLSPSLFGELAQKVLKRKLEDIFFIKHSQTGFRAQIASKLVIHHYLSTDFIFHTGEAALSLYILISGEVALVSEDTGHQYAKIFSSEGILGESEFFTKSCYCCAAQVTKDVVSYELSYEIFWFLVEKYNQQDNYAKHLRMNFLALWKMSTNNLVNTLNGNFKNSKMTKMLTTVRQGEYNGFFIPPSSLFSSGWTLLTLFFMIYTAISVPFVIAFVEITPTVLVFDTLQCIFFMIDIYLNIRYFAVEIEGILIKDWREFSSIYFDSELKWDLLPTLPIALIIYGTTTNMFVTSITRLLYYLRFRRFEFHTQRLLTIIESKLDYRFSTNFIRMIKMVFVVWYFGHVACCGLCWIGKQTQNSWIVENNFEEMSSFKIYLRGYLWSMYTIITVGYGNIQLVKDIERIFAVVVMLTGAILCDAGVIAVLSSLIAQTDKQSATMRRSRQAAIAFCNSNQLSEQIREKLNAYYDYLSLELKDCIETEDFKFLPKTIFHELIQLRSFDALCSLCLIDVESSEHRLGFVYSMVRFACPTIATPGQILLQSGNDSDLHILRKGKAYTRYYGVDGSECSSRDYFQEGEILCRDGRLNTSNAMSPGKLVQITLGSLQGVSITGGNFSIASALHHSNGNPFGGSSIYVRLSCGARKAWSTKKSPSTQLITSWKELFTFHVPQAAASLNLSFFDEKQTENGGYVGQAVLNFNELETMEQYQSIPSGSIHRPHVVMDQTVKENVCDHVPSMSKSGTSETSTSGEPNVLSQDTEECVASMLPNKIYSVKQGVRDKNGRLKGFVTLQINIKNAGVADDNVAKRQSDFLKKRKLSTRPVEVVAESFCHLFTIDGRKLIELKSFYRNHLRPGKILDISYHERKKRISSCGQAAILSVIRKRSQDNFAPKVVSNEDYRRVSRLVPENLQSVGMILKSRRSCRPSEISPLNSENTTNPIPRTEQLPVSNEECKERKNRASEVEMNPDSDASSLPDISDQDSARRSSRNIKSSRRH